MRSIIESVLQRHQDRQINLASKAARKAIAEEIALVLADRGTYTEYGDDEIEKEKARETWVCSICGKNTFEVDFDYIGSGANHLGCELQADTDNAAGVNPNDDTDHYTGPDWTGPGSTGSGHYERYGDIPHTPTDHEEAVPVTKYPIPEYDLQTGQKNPLYGEFIQEMDQKITQMEEAIQPWQKERSKLSDQLIDGSDGEPRYIYESPDGGKTIYRRPIGNYDPVVKELVKSPDRDISFKPEF